MRNVIATVNLRGIRSEIEVNSLNETVVITRGTDVSVDRAGQFLHNEAPLAYRTRLYRDFNGRLIHREVETRDSHTDGVGPWIDRS